MKKNVEVGQTFLYLAIQNRVVVLSNGKGSTESMGSWGVWEMGRWGDGGMGSVGEIKK